MASPVAKRSVVIGGHKTSVSLEEEFWTAIKEIAALRRQTIADLVSFIDANRRLGASGRGNLSSALRLFVLAHFRAAGAGERSAA
ncbi:ribbon-helix-helix domain-containing protein [Ancylobacter dichloromethanicus]|uniref:ribbon-helix-helix domain-containing protein n=1 Tax=Ancylobacter dichloromethanicus TaxID=518825 RepID=UPI001BCE96BD|nr:ribbon-helix-helix domain-containing protein [Ancylobacter dichloromethanicus]MBS7553511.1 ribbon-helix-helix domain-containing protein [Ancylobacter dichloromethanicus]